MTDDTDTSAPERIWLQTGGNYAESHEAAIGTDTGVTWAANKVEDDDQAYVRADLYEALRERAEKAEAEVEKLLRIFRTMEGQARAAVNAAQGIVNDCAALRDTRAALTDTQEAGQ